MQDLDVAEHRAEVGRLLSRRSRRITARWLISFGCLVLAAAVALANLPTLLNGAPLNDILRHWRTPINRPSLFVNIPWDAVAVVLTVALTVTLVWGLRRSTAYGRVLKRVAHDSRFDPLTGLPNRTHLLDRVRAFAAGWHTAGQGCALIVVDLDGFRMVNDSYGQRVGDQIIVEVGRRLTACLGPGGFAARLGPDEFAVFLADVECQDQAEALAVRLSTMIASPFNIEKETIHLTASIGTTFSDSHAPHEEVLANASLALSTARKKGPAGREAFTPAMRAFARERIEIERDLRGVIERGELQLYYQPVVQLEGGGYQEMEALVRWNHPRRGLMNPAEFISLAEETGQIVPIGRWILATACRQMNVWHKTFQSARNHVLSVNLSPRQVLDPGLVQDVREIVRQSGLDPASLKLEITESAMLRDFEKLTETLAALRATGIRISVDDFGTGFASLAYLRRFPVDALKIDRTFIGGLGQYPADDAIVRSIIDLARTLDLAVVGEGIETAEQHLHLQRLGCLQGQGFHFARPVTEASATELLARQHALAA